MTVLDLTKLNGFRDLRKPFVVVDGLNTKQCEILSQLYWHNQNTVTDIVQRVYNKPDNSYRTLVRRDLQVIADRVPGVISGVASDRVTVLRQWRDRLSREALFIQDTHPPTKFTVPEDKPLGFRRSRMAVRLIGLICTLPRRLIPFQLIDDACRFDEKEVKCHSGATQLVDVIHKVTGFEGSPRVHRLRGAGVYVRPHELPWFERLLR